SPSIGICVPPVTVFPPVLLVLPGLPPMLLLPVRDDAGAPPCVPERPVFEAAEAPLAVLVTLEVAPPAGELPL
ncbi:MAG: hypothetical protein ACM3ZE_22410, partial [Myxococcales bacterium]